MVNSLGTRRFDGTAGLAWRHWACNHVSRVALALGGERKLIVGAITEMTVIGAYDRGVPNQERIVLRANGAVSLGQFALFLGIRQESGFVTPIRDNFYWFGDGILSKGDWIFLYTGPGEGRSNVAPNTTEKLYTVHWNRSHTILNSHEIVPVLMRIDAIQVPVERLPLPDRSLRNTT